MAQVNVKNRSNLKTHEGGPAKMINAEMQLKRAVLACLLWEDTFYESGEDIATRMANLVANVEASKVMRLAEVARKRYNLRHAPLMLLREATRYGAPIAESLANTISRADELSEFVSLYWKNGKEPLSKQAKMGLAKAFTKFDEYSLSKYNRDKDVKLRDVLFLSHAKPKDIAQADLWKRLVDGTLEAPDTWERNLSSGADKKETWERLMKENKLGALALLRNLRNMIETDVDTATIRTALKTMKTEKVLPFRFIAAEKHAPSLSADIEGAMIRSLGDYEKLSGKTILLVDSSGSMVGTKVSGRSELDRLDAACALAILAREICEDVRVFAFTTSGDWGSAKSVVTEVPNRRGFALRDFITNMRHGGTYMGGAVTEMNKIPHDRLIVFTDEQSADKVPDPVAKNAYVVNVASYENGVGYGRWNHIDGFSTAVMDYIIEYEKEFE
jgi:60 kDa SS-A/Ro ribonucleoprotein